MSKTLYNLEGIPQSSRHLSIGAVASRFLWLGFVVTIPPLCLYLDIRAFGSEIPEQSFIEITQEVFLFICIGLFSYLAYRKPVDRVFAVMAAAFFACLLIRELDALFDQIVHGLWKYIATPVAVTALMYGTKNIHSMLSGLSRFLHSQAGVIMIVGLVVLLFYSRLFGMADLWRALMGEGYIHTVKKAVEETCELLGYSLIIAASARYLLHRLRDK
jgi:hypothetical protein